METEKLQCLLAYLGYYTLRDSKGHLAIDNIPGRALSQAIREFQTDHYCQITGEADSTTEQAIITAVANEEPIPDGGAEIPPIDDGWPGKHFARKEFACQCGGRYCNGYPAEINTDLVKLLDNIREHFGKPVTITSGLRCQRHNANVGGVSNSQHLYGTAADIVVQGVSPATVADYAEQQVGDKGGVGRYSSFTHVDVRGHKARWRG